MSQDDQIRWDRQHGESDGIERPSTFLRQVLKSDSWRLAPGRALDVACGKGRNALFLAARGFRVTAVDISPIALEIGRRRAKARALPVDWRQADLDHFHLKAAEYDLVVNFNYLQRALIPSIKAALRPGGHVIFETYLIDQQAIGRPKNPAYLLAHNELLEHFRNFRVFCYREGKFRDHRESSFRAGIFAQKPG
jgi:SAM-dependent methyltransferase